MRKILTSLAIAIAAAVAITETVQQLGAVSNTVVISQVYGGGGNSSATYQNDFVELFNRGSAAVDITGWTLQYATSGQSTAWTPIATLSGTLQPGQYYLVAEAGGTVGAPLPPADASGTTNLNQGNAKVALVSSATALPASATGCPTSGAIVDLVGYGTNTIVCAEGTAVAALSATKSATRAGAGCTDTDNNAADFAVVTPAARTKNSPLAPCSGDAAPSVSSTTPASGATNVAFNASIVINFSESVTASASAFSLDCPAGAPQAFTQSASPSATITLTPNAPLPVGTTCTVKVTAAQVTDTDTIDPPDAMASDVSFSFSTVNPVDAAPSVVSAAPANGSTNVPITSPLVVTFSESVTASAIAFSLQCPAGVPQPFLQSASPATAFTLTPSAPLPYDTSCAVTVTANQISDTDTNDPPDGMASDVAFSFTTAKAPPPGAGKVMINEIDADTPGSDTAEFIELYDGGSGNTPLDGLVVVLYDGGLTPFSGNQVYAAFDLAGKSTDGNGYFVLGNPGVPNAGLTFAPGDFGLLQNGPDAVALYIGQASDFPTGKVVTATNLLDAVVYGTDDPAPANLMSLINPGQKIVNENATGNGTTQSSQRCPNGMGGFRNTSPYYPGTPTPGAANTCPAARPSSDVVISQIYGGGGNSGATYINDYVELYNRGAGTVDLSGWSFQYSPAASNGSSFLVQPIGGSIGAGEYYLIQLASGGAVGAPLPVDANIVGNINISATNGKVALVNSFDALLGGCPIYDPHIMDFVGYGSADCSEGLKAAPTLSNTTADFRKGGGGQDTDVNGDDFLLSATPLPRRTAVIVELQPFVFRTDPVRNGLDVPRDATIDVTFTEAVTVDSAWFNLTCAASGQHNSATFASSSGGQDQYITPNDNFIAGEQCTVTVFKDRVHDEDTNDSGPNTDTLPADYSWSFTVASGAAPPYPASVHLTMGNPSAAGSDPLNYLMEKPEFALSYNRDLGRPNWVSWHLSDEWIGTLVRADTFRPDPQVPPDWYRVQSFDFSGTGFDRGHMTPNADRDKETSIPINQATFLMSNMVAQAPLNNQGPWADLEAYLRTLTDPNNLIEGNNELYIVAGPNGVGGTGSLGGVTNTVANGHVTVPASTWKVALVLPKGSGDDRSRVTCSTRTIAVIMPNTQAINTDWHTYLTTVDAVEALTGYDFFSNLPEPYQRCIEGGTNGNNLPLVKGDQAITFPQPADSIYGDAPFTVSATGGGSGNPVTFAASGACTSSGFNDATITVLTPGSCTITASQAGSIIYNGAPDAVRTLTVGRAALAVSAADKTREYGAPDPPFTGTLTGVVSGDNIAASFSASDVPASPPGTYPIVVSLNDPDGRLVNYNVTMHDGLLTIVDTTPPTLTLPANITTAESSRAGRAVSYVATASDLVDGAVSVSCSPASGAMFAVGTTTVTCAAHDAHANSASGSFTVTVTTDTRVPRITDPGRVVVEATSPAGAVATFTVSAIDDRDGAVPVVCVPASGSTFSLGRTTVSCTASDISGNVKTDEFPVTVRDTTDPEIVGVTPASGYSFTLSPTGLMTPVVFAVDAHDIADSNPMCAVTRVTSNVRDIDHDGALDWSITGPLSVSLEAATRQHKDRNYLVTITCTDASGNASKEKTTVVVSHLP